MNASRYLGAFCRHAAGVIVATPAGTVIETRTHPDLDRAPLKLIVLVEADGAEPRTVVGEIGIGRGHPWCSNHSCVNLPHRTPEKPMCRDFLGGITPDIIALLATFVHAQTRRWKHPAFTRWRTKERVSRRTKELMPVRRNGRYVSTPYAILRGLGISVSHRDTALLSLFEEFEWANPAFQRRIAGMAVVLNFLTRPYRPRLLRRPFPRGVDSAVYLLRRRDSRMLLRPHVLGAILRQVKNAELLLDALTVERVISEATYLQTFQRAMRRSEPPSVPILPTHTGQQRKIDSDLTVMLRTRHHSHDAFTVAIAQTRVIAANENARTRAEEASETPSWIYE